MFIGFATATLALVSYLSLRHFWKGRPSSWRAANKSIDAASQHLALRHFEEAKSLVLPYLHHQTLGHLAHLRYAEALRGLRRLDEALNCIHYAAKCYPEELLLRLEEGKILLELNRPDEALKAFQVCSPILRQDSDILALCAALLRAGHAETAWELVEKRLETSNHVQLTLLGAKILSTLGRLPGSIDLYNRVIEQGEKSHDVLGGLADAYRRHGNLQAAEHLFRTLLDKDPSDVDATLGLGACMEEREQTPKAFLFYKSGHAWEKKDSRLIKQTAICAMRLGRYEEAEELFSALMPSLHLTPTLLSYYGYSLEQQEKWQEAETLYRETVARFPSDPNGYRALAWMFGVGVSLSITQEQGLTYAHIALKLLADPISWEILSACEARVGHFDKASQILEGLLAEEKVVERRSRLQAALRSLRKQHPLDNRLVGRALVA